MPTTGGASQIRPFSVTQASHSDRLFLPHLRHSATAARQSQVGQFPTSAARLSDDEVAPIAVALSSDDHQLGRLSF